jgi:hypothetical protein
MLPLRQITYKNKFFHKNNTLSREIHTYSETDYVERYRGFSIWKFETNCRNDGSRKFDIIVDDRVIETCGGDIDIHGVRVVIDKIADKMMDKLLKN